MSQHSDFQDVWKLIQGKNAQRVKIMDVPVNGDAEITRRWENIAEGYLSRCLQALAEFTDEKNPSPMRYVVDPEVDREKFPGIYRQVTLDVDVQKPGLRGIIQTLRKGWAKTANWDEARLLECKYGAANDVNVPGIGNTQSDNPIRFARILFPNCAQDSLTAIARELASRTTYSDLNVGGNLLAGEWRTIYAGEKLNEDGSGSVELFIGRIQYVLQAYDNFGTERTYDVYYLYDVPRPAAQGIMDSWKTQNPKDSSATASYSRSNDSVDIILRKKASEESRHDAGSVDIDCRYSRIMVMYLGCASANDHPIPNNVGDGISYSRTVRPNGDGTFDITIVRQVVRPRNIENLVIEQTAEETVFQRQQLGLTSQPMASMAEEPGKIKTQSVEVRDDCSRDVKTNTSVGKPQESRRVIVAPGMREVVIEKTYQTSALPEPTKEDGHIRTAETSASKYPNRVNTRETDREVYRLQAKATGGSCLFEEEVEDVNNDDADLSDAGPGPVGTVINAVSTKNEAGKFNNRKTKSTAIPFGPLVSISGTPLLEETLELSRNQSVLPSPGAGSPGNGFDVSGSVNDHARVDSVVRKKKAIKFSTAKYRSGTPLFEDEQIIEKNLDVVPNPGAGTTGQRTDVQAAVTELGKIDAVTTIRTAHPCGPHSDMHGSALVSEETLISRNQTSLPNAGIPPIGETHDVSAQITNEGRFDLIRTIRRFISIVFGPYKSAENVFSTEETTIKVNQDNLTEMTGPGEVLRVGVDVNQSGKLDAKIVREKAKTITLGPHTIHDDGLFKIDRYLHRNISTPPAIGYDDNGHDLIQVNYNEYGKYDVVEDRKVAREFFVDIEEPAFGETASAFQRIYYGIDSSSKLQARIQAFAAIVASKSAKHQYRINASVSRDMDGFYQLTVVANPKDSSGGGGSVLDWENGIEYEFPATFKYKDVAKTSGKIVFTTSKNTIRNLINVNNLVDYGVAGKTGVYHIGRGRYKVVLNYAAE